MAAYWNLKVCLMYFLGGIPEKYQGLANQEIIEEKGFFFNEWHF
jgi:hypothetical protein